MASYSTKSSASTFWLSSVLLEVVGGADSWTFQKDGRRRRFKTEGEARVLQDICRRFLEQSGTLQDGERGRYKTGAGVFSRKSWAVPNPERFRKTGGEGVSRQGARQGRCDRYAGVYIKEMDVTRRRRGRHKRYAGGFGRKSCAVPIPEH